MQKKGEQKQSNIRRFLFGFLQAWVVLTILYGIATFEWLIAFEAIIVLISFYIPSIIEKRLQVDLPGELEILIVFFLVASLFLGEVQNFYELFWWWDIFLHTISGIILGLAGFLILFSLYIRKRLQMSAFLLSIFAFSFALALGTVWEIFEFIMDSTFGFNMQKSGLVDTMWDLIVDALGALIVATMGYFYIKYKKSPLSYFDQFLDRFIKNNPETH